MEVDSTRDRGHGHRVVQDAILDQDPILVETDVTRGRGHNRWGTQDAVTLAQDPVQVKPAATLGRSLDYLATLDLDPEAVVGLGPEEEGGAVALQNHRTWGKCNLREKWAPKKLLIRRSFSISQSTCAYLGIMPFSSMCELAVRSVQKKLMIH